MVKVLKLSLNGQSSHFVSASADNPAPTVQIENMLDVLRHELANLMDSHETPAKGEEDQNDWFQISVGEMSEEDLRDLPEWDGW